MLRSLEGMGVGLAPLLFVVVSACYDFDLVTYWLVGYLNLVTLLFLPFFRTHYYFFVACIFSFFAHGSPQPNVLWTKFSSIENVPFMPVSEGRRDNISFFLTLGFIWLRDLLLQASRNNTAFYTFRGLFGR